MAPGHPVEREPKAPCTWMSHRLGCGLPARAGSAGHMRPSEKLPAGSDSLLFPRGRSLGAGVEFGVVATGGVCGRENRAATTALDWSPCCKF